MESSDIMIKFLIFCLKLGKLPQLSRYCVYQTRVYSVNLILYMVFNINYFSHPQIKYSKWSQDKLVLKAPGVRFSTINLVHTVPNKHVPSFNAQNILEDKKTMKHNNSL